MSSKLMDVEVGGEQTQCVPPLLKHWKLATTDFCRYEGEATDVQPHKKSGGQFGSVETTTDITETEEYKKQHAEAGERKAANMRYGQAISEEGFGGVTTGQQGSAQQSGTGSTATAADDTARSEETRAASGYGGEKDMNQDIGA